MNKYGAVLDDIGMENMLNQLAQWLRVSGAMM